MTQTVQDFSTILRPAPDMQAEVVDRDMAVTQIASQIKTDETAATLFAQACRFETHAGSG